MIKNLILSIISASDLLENARLNDGERRALRDIMECNFSEADRLGIPYKVQNAALVAGCSNRGRRYCSSLTTEIMQQYANRLTPEARAEWKEFCEKRVQEC